MGSISKAIDCLSDCSPNYSSGLSPGMESKSGSCFLSRAKGRGRGRGSSCAGVATVANPRAKRKLYFDVAEWQPCLENENEIEPQPQPSPSRDEAFRDLASILRGVLAVKRRQKDMPTNTLMTFQQVKLCNPQDNDSNNDVKVRRRLNLMEAGQNFKIFTKTLGKEQLGAGNLKERSKAARGFMHLSKNSVQEPLSKQNFKKSGVIHRYNTSLAKDNGDGGARQGLQNDQNLKGLSNGLVKEEIQPMEENMKKCNEDGEQRLKKYSRSSARKRSGEAVDQRFEKPNALVRKEHGQDIQGLGESKGCQNIGNLGRILIQGLVNEPAVRKLKIFNTDTGETLGNKVIGCSTSTAPGNGPVPQGVLEMRGEVLKGNRGNMSTFSTSSSSQKLIKLGSDLVQEPAKKLAGGKLEQFDEVKSEVPGNEAIGPSFKKYSRSSTKRQRSGNSHAILGETKAEGNSQNIRDLSNTLDQEPMSGSVEVKKYNEDRSKELGNEVGGHGFVKCRTNSTKASKNLSSVCQGFDNSCAVLGDEPKIQNFACLVGPKVKSISNSSKLVSMNEGPYPHFNRPSSEECRGIRDLLLELHGFPEEFAKVRARIKERVPVPSEAQPQLLPLHKKYDREFVKTEENYAKHSCFEKKESKIVPRVLPYEPQETVLDSLISTLLSQNTTDANSRRAFDTLKAKFPTWDKVHKADPKAVEDAIRCGGLAETKASRIQNILDTLLKENGKICLEHLRNMPIEKIKAELCRFKGVGSKTVACILMFHLQQDDFPVDTHVFQITKSLGWVPPEADREKAYLHLNCCIPNDLKFDLNCLLVTHGKCCPSCSKRGRLHQAPYGPCPLLRTVLPTISHASVQYTTL